MGTRRILRGDREQLQSRMVHANEEWVSSCNYLQGQCCRSSPSLREWIIVYARHSPTATRFARTRGWVGWISSTGREADAAERLIPAWWRCDNRWDIVEKQYWCGKDCQTSRGSTPELVLSGENLDVTRNAQFEEQQRSSHWDQGCWRWCQSWEYAWIICSGDARWRQKYYCLLDWSLNIQCTLAVSSGDHNNHVSMLWKLKEYNNTSGGDIWQGCWC